MRNPQRGIFLISAAIAVAIVGMLITFGMNQYVQSLRTHKAESVGEALKVIGEGVQSFIVEHHAEIREAFDDKPQTVQHTGDITGVVRLTRIVTASENMLRISVGGESPRELTAADIIALMKLAGVGDQPPLMPDASYRIRIFADIKGSKTQDIRGLVYLDKPFTKTYGGGVDWTQLSTALRKMGVHGGFSRKDDETRFTFPLTPSGATVNQRQLPNPTGDAGILAMRAGYLLGPLSAYLRRDGSEAMTGDLDMGEQNIANISKLSGRAGTLQIDGQVDVTRRLLVGPGAASLASAAGISAADEWIIAGKGIASGNVIAGTSVEMQRDLSTDNGVVAAVNDVWAYRDVWAKRNIYNRDGDITVRGTSDRGNITATRDISAGRNLTANGSVQGRQLQTTGGSRLDLTSLTLGKEGASPGAACAPNNKIARDASGMFYVCQGTWQTLKGATGPRGPSGPWGPTGPRGNDGKDAKFKPKITRYDVNACYYNDTFYTEPHDVCWLARVDANECSYWGVVGTKAIISRSVAGTRLEGTNFDYAETYTPQKVRFMLTTRQTRATMHCLDFD